jgi:FKBP-type peptidyl-prolyl cis-trans isomerase
VTVRLSHMELIMNLVRHGSALLLVLALAACTQQEEEKIVADLALDSTEKRLSYGIAYGFGQRLKEDGVPLDADAFGLGLRHAYDGVEPILSTEEIGEELQAYQAAQSAANGEKVKAAGESNAEQGAAFLAGNAKAEGVVVLPSGLQYKVVTDGSGAKPGPEDVVEVNYRGTLIDGTEFDSSYARNQSVSFAVNQVIPGFTEGLQLMPVGSSYQLFIPPGLAYGADGAGQDIGPNATLIFDVELLEIKEVGESQ